MSDSGYRDATWYSNSTEDLASYMERRKFTPSSEYKDGDPRKWSSERPYDNGKGARSELAFNIYSNYSRFISPRIEARIREKVGVSTIENVRMTFVADLRIPLSPRYCSFVTRPDNLLGRQTDLILKSFSDTADY